MLFRFKDIAYEAMQGNTDPLLAYAELKAYKMELDQAIKDVEPAALDESEKYGKSFELHGVKFEKSSKQAIGALKNGFNYIDGNGEEIPLPKVTYNKDSLIIK